MLLTDLAQLKSTRAGEPVTVVIGSGAIGLYAASELVKRGQRVIVVESGGVHLGGFSPESYDSVGVRHDGVKVARSRSLGGTTNLWGGQLVEFQPVDFAGRDWLPGSAWPVKYEEIAPFYRVTCETLGTSGRRLTTTQSGRAFRRSGRALATTLKRSSRGGSRFRASPSCTRSSMRRVKSSPC